MFYFNLCLAPLARNIAVSFRAAASSCDAGEPAAAAAALEGFANSAVEVFRAGYDLDIVQLEADMVDDALAPSQKRQRRRWLRAVRHTVRAAAGQQQSLEQGQGRGRGPPKLKDPEDVEIAALVAFVVDATAAATSINSSNRRHDTPRAKKTTTTTTTTDGGVPLSRIILLAMHRLWQIEADDLYPGATG